MAGTTFSTAGSTNWVVPSDVTVVTVKAWGGGGGGGGTAGGLGGGGGAGGAYAIGLGTVTGGGTYAVVVGGGGTASATGAGGSGTSSYFGGSLVLAPGGVGGTAGGAGGAGGTAGGAGGTFYAGGNGGSNSGGTAGGGGGGGAGTNAVGGNASGRTGGTAGPDGGAGGNARAIGTAPGGGGGGREKTSAGAAGAVGQLIISYDSNFDTFSNSGTLANISVGTVTHTVGALTNGLLAVVTQCRCTGTPSNMPITSVQFNGTNMTYGTSGSQTGHSSAEVWYMTNPPAGVGSIVVTYTGVNSFVTFGGISLSGINQTTPVDTRAIGTDDAGTNISCVFTTTSDNCWIIDSIYHLSAGTIIAGAGQTQIYNDYPNGGSASGDTTSASYRGPFTPAGAGTNRYGASAADEYGHALVAFKPFVATPGTPAEYSSFKTLLGVGF